MGGGGGGGGEAGMKGVIGVAKEPIFDRKSFVKFHLVVFETLFRVIISSTFSF